METKKFEDTRWSQKDQKLVFRHAVTMELIEYGKILDLGCGDGLLLELLKGKGLDVIGLDMSSEGVEKCQRRGVTASVLDFTDEKLPYDDETFSTVIMLDVLEHLYFPGEVLAEAVRVSSDSIIIGVPNFNSIPARVQVLLGRVPENNRSNKGHVFWFNLRALKDMLEKANLCIVELRTNAVWDSKPVIGGVMKLLSRIMPGLFALSFVLKAKKT